ncbi:structural maintenance of chromosomes flexible hinge domain-containing protein 1 isoform X2 [Acanthochromis polyacanthus]|uniref:structural maintenance of chromosomes flexible hinge domain-containing protein 1 isoform X2 n=1 Tax=Acanthochromis polyacanthus TaxID=80966 RepID=UPI002234B03D|nr:structural maintenance of chromosomes flexible hinge domain-containing protein 1 isoform X2 [Acanthochromis polyacanthus]
MLSSSQAVGAPPRGRTSRRIRVCDLRLDKQERTEKHLETRDMDFNDFLQDLEKEFRINPRESFVVETTDRTVLDFDKFEKVQDGSTLYLLQHEHQALPVAAEEHITFTPHYDTLIRGGMYEYYASQGQAPLAYTLAELIDNALSATAKNKGQRTIEIRVLNDRTVGKPAIVVLDNGCGMTSKQLKNWAVYRLSKFTKESSTFASDKEVYVRPEHVPRSLNSDISYFGVGGKQAVFYIGDSARMISKPVGSPDVHELVLSKEEFVRKEKNKEDVFSGVIVNRKPGSSSHILNNDERFLQALIAEECGKESFTAVVITGVQPEHITFLTERFNVVTRELAHIYHYYIHGVNGNVRNKSSSNSDDLKIDIHVTLREKPPKYPRAIHLREVEHDMQTLYINAAADTFEFRASTAADNGTVEGVIRYHPFLYDKETYPKRPEAPDNDDDDNESGFIDQARKKMPIFECFWNGRLIPYTTVSEFDWCSPNKGAKVPAECYSRLSGVLFTDDRFQVTTNKLTFTDLELKLKNKDTIYTTVVNGQKSSKRANIQNEFSLWLQNCHEKFDKQVKFLGYKETITRTDVPTKRMQHPWGTFSSIEWDGKTYTIGQRVKSLRTIPVFYGTIVRFLLYGIYDGDVFATGGQVEVIREPRALYDTVRIIPISKIDKTATDEAIKKNIDNDCVKIPELLKVVWPKGNEWPQNAVCPAGTPLGPINVEILNKKGESMSSMPSAGQGKGPALSMHLKIVLHGSKGDQVISDLLAQHSAKWGFEFKKNENLTQLGKYTLSLNTVMKDSNKSVFGGKQLPNFTLKFTIKEGDAQSFIITTVSPSVRVGVPFNIPLQFKDLYGHLTAPPPKLSPVLGCSGLDVKYETVDSRGTTFTVKNVTVKGKILNYQQNQSYDLKVFMSGLRTHTQAVKIILHPGIPHSLHVMPEEDPVKVENGNPVAFSVEILDEAGNITAHPRQIVRCQVEELPLVTVDCSNTGAGQLMTKPINLKIIDGQPQVRKAHFEMPSQRHVASVIRELKVIPSTRVALMQVYSADDDNLVLRNNDKIDWVVGGVLENLFYRLYDEAGSEVTVSAEIASMIKVNWTGDVDLEDLIQRKLPDIEVPTQVQEERFFQVSYHDQSVSVSFTITPRPDEPTRLKVTLPQNTVRLGEALPGNINLEPVDQYDNVTKTLSPTCVRDMSVEAKGLDKSSIVFTWQQWSSSVAVTGVRFNSGPLGHREMCFKYTTFVERIKIEVTAGVPAELKLISGPEQPLQLFSDHGISEPFLVQLYDEWGNPSPDKRVVVQLRSPTTLKVTAAVMSQPVNAQGKASFTVKTVSGPKGCYKLQFTGFFNKKPIPGPSVNLTIIPDRSKPVKLSAEYDSNVKFLAGGIFPVFSVTVVSEEGSPITTFNPAAVSMFLWNGVSSGETPPPTVTELKCSKPMEHDKNDRFYFRDKQIPEHAGPHVVQFSLRVDETKQLFSDQIPITVVANQPVKLGPDSQPRTPVVSNSKDITSRTLVENMTLRIMDSHGNPAGQDLNGRVAVSIKCTNGDKSKSLPLFEGKIHSFRLDLVEGKAHVTRLAIMENSPGQNGSAYTLLFQPEVPNVPTPLSPFELQFHFYNDADNQAKISQLTKQKDELTLAIAAYEDIFLTSTELLKLLTTQHLTASSKENNLRNELHKRNMTITQPVSSQTIDTLINKKSADVDKILKMPRRSCSIRENFMLQPDVLGTVGHLAFVEDDTAARVISWHISGDMDCIITKTKEAAERIHRETQGRQQVMALDSVFVPPGNRPLPHIRNGHTLFDPPGNPVYARELLICPNEQESCGIVFKNILGDTILIDDLQSANSYRRAVVQNKSPCPTILTRQGDRVSAKGKFGGAQNKAPATQMFPMFGAPLPQTYHTLRNDIELLQQYQIAVRKREEAEKERNDHLKNLYSPEMKMKKQELEEKKKLLEDIDRQLASTPVTPVKRGAEDAGEPSDIVTKRPRQRLFNPT